MKNNKSNFLFGLVAGLIIFPIFESTEEIIIGAMEVAKSKITQKILKENKIINDLQAEMESDNQEIDTYAIGFDLSQQDDDEYFDD